MSNYKRTIAKNCSGRKWYTKSSPTVRHIQLKSIQHSTVYGPTQHHNHGKNTTNKYKGNVFIS